MDVLARSQVHSALGDVHRLRIVDELRTSDRTFQELATLVGLPGNAAAHHLLVLESAGLIERRVSEGDRRRRYLSLRHNVLTELEPRVEQLPTTVLFVCTHNSARSQFAAALWSYRAIGRSESAGTEPQLASIQRRSGTRRTTGSTSVTRPRRVMATSHLNPTSSFRCAIERERQTCRSTPRRFIGRSRIPSRRIRPMRSGLLSPRSLSGSIDSPLRAMTRRTR